MSNELSQLSWCILGGDRRDLFFARAMLELGYNVRVCSIPGVEDLPHSIVVPDPSQAVHSASVLVCPVTGTDDSGVLRKSTIPINLPKLLYDAAQTTILVIGSAKQAVQEAAVARNIMVIESMHDDELAILNSIPSAEGAVQMAMEHSDFTIHGSRSIVLGYGRTGLTLASVLQGLKSEVTVAARKPQDLARAKALGHAPVRFSELKAILHSFDLIFNTVPALVLSRELVALIKETAIVIDLASPPGGVDFDAAQERGVTALLAPGLPGQVAPRTAGRILSTVIPRLVGEAIESYSRFNGK